jgi:hypothetical protein
VQLRNCPFWEKKNFLEVNAINEALRLYFNSIPFTKCANLVDQGRENRVLDEVVPPAKEDEEVDDGGEGFALYAGVGRLEDDLLHQLHVAVEHIAQVEYVVGSRVALRCLQKHILQF